MVYYKKIRKRNFMIDKEKIYLVGGAVRDTLLGIPIHDKDYVIVGASVQDMLDAGFTQVGASFPVFLDPVHKEEYALARTERKTGKGYTGFTTQTEGVSLKEDLSRRDLTINAMAQNTRGELFDPYQGQLDLHQKILRHVSESFQEDPVRILRVARFACKYPDFTIAPETMELMTKMVKDGLLDEVTPERLFLEFKKVAQTKKPSRFIRILHECDALQKILPEVDVLYGVPQVELYHPEIDTGIHTEMVMDQAALLAPGDVSVLFAAMTHDVGKGLTPKEEWPKHIDHEKIGLKPLENLLKRWKVPSSCAYLSRLVCEHHLRCHRVLESRPISILNLLISTNAFRQSTQLSPFILACEADKKGRLFKENNPYHQGDLLNLCYQACQHISSKPFVEKGFHGIEIKEAVRSARLKAITETLKLYQNQKKELEKKVKI